MGTNRRVSDGGAWNKCGLAQTIKDGLVALPAHKCLPFGFKKVPHVIVADDAFALKTYIMSPTLKKV